MLLTVIFEVGNGGRKAGEAVVSLSLRFAQKDKLSGITKRQGAQKNGIHHAEEGGIGANAKRKRENGG